MKIDFVYNNAENFVQTLQTETGLAETIFLRDKVLHVKYGVVPDNQWEHVVYNNAVKLSQDANISMLDSSHIPGVASVIVWKDGDTHRVAVVPDEGSLYGPNSMYRQYHATDTKRTYMNIEDTWQLIATLDHTGLSNAGTMTHQQIEQALLQSVSKTDFSNYQETMANTIVALMDLIRGGV